MPDRVYEHKVTYENRLTGDTTTVRYFTAAHADYRRLAETVAASELSTEEVDAVESYNRACADGVARFITSTKEAVE